MLLLSLKGVEAVVFLLIWRFILLGLEKGE